MTKIPLRIVIDAEYMSFVAYRIRTVGAITVRVEAIDKDDKVIDHNTVAFHVLEDRDEYATYERAMEWVKGMQAADPTEPEFQIIKGEALSALVLTPRKDPA